MDEISEAAKDIVVDEEMMVASNRKENVFVTNVFVLLREKIQLFTPFQLPQGNPVIIPMLY